MKCQIGIDARMMRHTGIGTYISELSREFIRTGMARKNSVAFFGAPRSHQFDHEISRYSFHSPIYSVVEQVEYPFALGRCKLWHAPHYNVPIYKGKTKLIVTIHDLIHWIFRKDFFTPLQALYASHMLQHALKSADHVITVSCKTRDDLALYFDADLERISVIYEGVGDQFREMSREETKATREKYKLPDNYFLYVGSLKPHKNVLWLIRLFRKLRQEQKIDSVLVLVGKKDKRYPADYRELAELETGKDIVHLQQVAPEELIALYNHAIALIHPSLYEGFGLTLLEAMACGVPVIASRTSSIPEVVGDSAFLVDPCSEREMIEAIVRFEKIPTLREEYQRKGKRHSQRFRWAETAEKTAEVYERVLSA